MAAWGPGSSSIIQALPNSKFVEGPASVQTPLYAGEKACNVEAVSCSGNNYNGCCVPTLGKFTLSQQWIPDRVESKFTIHGLWPGDCITGRSSDDICDLTRDYGQELEGYIRGKPLLYAKMQADMPSRFGDSLAHWKHQWRKHGTCVSDIKPGCHNLRKGQDVVRYFKMTTELYDTYDVTSALTRGTVVPRNAPYTSQNFYNALKAWGNHLTLHCINNKIVEIRIYLTGKYGNKFKADPHHHGRGNCSNNIIFPSKTSFHTKVKSQAGTSAVNNKPRAPAVNTQPRVTVPGTLPRVTVAGAQSQANIAGKQTRAPVTGNPSQASSNGNINRASVNGNPNRAYVNSNRQQTYVPNGQSRVPVVGNPFQSQVPNIPNRGPVNNQFQTSMVNNQFRGQGNGNRLNGQVNNRSQNRHRH